MWERAGRRFRSVLGARGRVFSLLAMQQARRATAGGQSRARYAILKRGFAGISADGGPGARRQFRGDEAGPGDGCTSGLDPARLEPSLHPAG